MGSIMIFLLIISLISCVYIVAPLFSTKNEHKVSLFHMLATFSSLISLSIVSVILIEYYFGEAYIVVSL